MKESTKVLLIIGAVLLVAFLLVGLGFKIREWTQDSESRADTSVRSGVEFIETGRARLDSIARANLDLGYKLRTTDSARRAAVRFYEQAIANLNVEQDTAEWVDVMSATLDTMLDRLVRVGDSVYRLQDTIHARYVGPPGNYFTDVWIGLASTPARKDTIFITVIETIHEGASIFEIGKWVIVGAGAGVLAIEAVRILKRE